MSEQKRTWSQGAENIGHRIGEAGLTFGPGGPVFKVQMARDLAALKKALSACPFEIDVADIEALCGPDFSFTDGFVA